MKSRVLIPLVFSLIVFGSCGVEAPVPINYGEDACNYCNMNIVQKGFGTELITRKGKPFRFDSIECLAAFLHKGTIGSENIHSVWVTDYSNQKNLITMESATFVYSENMRSPMGMGLAAFGSGKEAEKFRASVDGIIIDWNSIDKMVTEAWKL